MQTVRRAFSDPIFRAFIGFLFFCVASIALLSSASSPLVLFITFAITLPFAYLYFTYVSAAQSIAESCGADSDRCMESVSQHIKNLQQELYRKNFELDQALQKSLQIADSADNIKSQFLSTISHELRTPMNGILGMTGLLMETPLSAEQREMLSHSKESAESLLDMINDILDYIKLEEKRVNLEFGECNIRELIKETMDLLESRAKARNINFTLDISDAVPENLLCDSDRVRQVLFYIINNSIKFTNNGFVLVKADFTHKADINPQITCEISDSGQGFNQDVLDALFLKFTPGESGMARRYGGLGLSLSICRNLVQLLGGQISAINKPDRGSAVTFSFRAKPITTPLHKKPSGNEVIAMPLLGSKYKYRILVAEDNRVNQALIKAFLKKYGHIIDIAANGKEAVNMIQNMPYDFILMDIQMPDMDGIEATSVIRRLPKPLCDIPIIAVTSNTLNMERQDYINAGMNDFVSKPIHLPNLLRVIDDVVGQNYGCKNLNASKSLI